MKSHDPSPPESTVPRKKRYDKPRLREYGSVAQLTAGGSGASLEGMSGMLGMN